MQSSGEDCLGPSIAGIYKDMMVKYNLYFFLFHFCNCALMKFIDLDNIPHQQSLHHKEYLLSQTFLFRDLLGIQVELWCTNEHPHGVGTS